MTEITTVRSLVEALGGFEAVARWAGYEDERGVYNWLTRGIPASHQLRLTIEVARKGLQVNPVVFGLEQQDTDDLRTLLTAARGYPSSMGATA